MGEALGFGIGCLVFQNLFNPRTREAGQRSGLLAWGRVWVGGRGRQHSRGRCGSFPHPHGSHMAGVGPVLTHCMLCRGAASGSQGHPHPSVLCGQLGQVLGPRLASAVDPLLLIPFHTHWLCPDASTWSEGNTSWALWVPLEVETTKDPPGNPSAPTRPKQHGTASHPFWTARVSKKPGT